MDWQLTIPAGKAGRGAVPSGARRRPVPVRSRARAKRPSCAVAARSPARPQAG